MKTLLVTIALGAMVISTQALAQERGGWMQQDMTRAQAQQMADAMFQRIDLNHDGVVTRDEAQQAASKFGQRGERMVDRLFGDAQSVTLQQAETQALARFDRDDANHDGVVTAAERQQARAAMKAERGQNPGQ
jgi:Ca2+-binding EF-hand superfamily protein